MEDGKDISQKKDDNSAAKISLIFGVLSLLFACVIPLFVFITADYGDSLLFGWLSPLVSILFAFISFAARKEESKRLDGSISIVEAEGATKEQVSKLKIRRKREKAVATGGQIVGGGIMLVVVLVVIAAFVIFLIILNGVT